MSLNFIRSKLAPPKVQRVLFQRERLSSVLAAIPDKRVTLVTSPAGYGKTSVLVNAYTDLTAQGLETAWISLDNSDNDLANFLFYWLSAILPGESKREESVLALVGTWINLPSHLIKIEFINRLHSLERGVTVFLDDWHLICSSEIIELINEMLRLELQKIHLVIASRVVPTLSLARIQVSGQLQTIGPQDLAFTIDETREFLRLVNGLEIAIYGINAVWEKTEGWAAGLQLAAIALRNSENPTRLIETFSGEHGSISDYLVEEVFQQQAPDIQHFLLATSFLSQFNASLAEAVTQSHNCRENISKIENANLFIFGLDEQRNWYRYHHLFADFLNRKLLDGYKDVIPTLHSRASTWYSELGYSVEAIEHAFAAGELDRAAELLELNSQKLFSSGNTAKLMSLTARLPSGLLDRSPSALIDVAWQQVACCWKFKEAQSTLCRARTAIEKRIANTEDRVNSADLASLRSKLEHREVILAVTEDDLTAALQKAREWQEADQTNDLIMRASSGSIIIQANREQFQCEGIAESSKFLRKLLFECGGLYSLVFHECISGATFFMVGDLESAESCYRLGKDAASRLHGENSALSSFPSSMLAELLFERNRLQEAEELIATHDMSADLGLVDKLIAGFITRSKLFALRGKHDESESALDDASYFALEYGFDRLHAHVLNERIKGLIKSNQAKLAKLYYSDRRYRHLLDLDIAPREGLTTTNELIATATARIWMVSGRCGDAITLLKKWIVHCKFRHCVRSVVRLSVLLAHAQILDRNKLAGQRTLIDALDIAESGGFIRSFLDESTEILDALIYLSDSPVHSERFSAAYLNEIQLSSKGGSTAGRPISQPFEGGIGAEDELSARELEILRLSAQGLTNQDIARTTALSESTVKWYWQQIFGKLGIRRRAEVIKHARRSNWIA